jgi:hypothetical protein
VSPMSATAGPEAVTLRVQARWRSLATALKAREP